MPEGLVPKVLFEGLPGADVLAQAEGDVSLCGAKQSWQTCWKSNGAVCGASRGSLEKSSARYSRGYCAYSSAASLLSFPESQVHALKAF